MKKLFSPQDLKQNPREVGRLARKVTRSRTASRREKILAYFALSLLQQKETEVLD